MIFRAIGDAIGSDIDAAQDDAADAFFAAHEPPNPPPTPADYIAYAQLMMRITGTGIVQHVPGYSGTTTTAPNTGGGLNLPLPALVMQVDGGGGFVALWWKNSDLAPTDWINITAGTGGGASNWDGGQADTNYGGTIAINGGNA